MIGLIEFNCIDKIALSNSSGNASPDESPKSPPESFEARSSLDSETASSNESSFACKRLNIEFIFSYARDGLS